MKRQARTILKACTRASPSYPAHIGETYLAQRHRVIVAESGKDEKEALISGISISGGPALQGTPLDEEAQKLIDQAAAAAALARSTRSN